MRFFIFLSLIGMSLAVPLNKTNSDFIFGGDQVEPGDCTFQVSLQQHGSHICGGSILNEYTVITAAHCVRSREIGHNRYRIRVGSLKHNEGGEIIRIANIIVHPDFNSEITDYDVAILKTETPITMDETTHTISMVDEDYDVEGEEVTVSGWGLTEESIYPEDLLKVTVPVVDHRICNRKYRGAITRQMFCAGVPEGGLDSCSGDSGGPVIVSEEGINKLVGIVSWGFGCAKPHYPGVYAYLPSMMSWISDNI